MSIIALSGGFDPIHSGHLDMICNAKAYGDVHIFLNTDEWLIRKKGFVFMPFDERALILRNIKGVDVVWRAKDTDNTVCESLKEYNLSIDYFGNGGDRKKFNSPETDMCELYSIIPVFDLGGEKTNSSSNLVARALNEATVQRKWGTYRTIWIGETSSGHRKKVKLLYINGRLGKQSHQKRSEHWICLNGVLETHEGPMSHGDEIVISHDSKHWAEGKGIILEIQIGSYLGEDDIERFE